MKQEELRRIYNLRPSLCEETNWIRLQLRITFRIVQLHNMRNPKMFHDPDRYLSQLSNSFMYLPSCGMLAFWLVAIRGRPSEETVLTAIFRMYAAAEEGVTFRRVAFPGYKQGRNFVPRGQGKRK